MCKELSEEVGFTVTRSKLRRFLKKLGFIWKRFRKSLKGKQDPKIYEAKLAELTELIELYKSNYIDLFYGDESGFNMQGYIPYGWQPKGKHIEIIPSKTKSRSVFGLMSLDNQLDAYTCNGSMNSAAIIAFINDFEKRIKKPTVIVLDNAPIHHSLEFQLKVKEWKEKDLYIFFLPKSMTSPKEVCYKKINV